MLLLVFVFARAASRGCTETIRWSAWLHACCEGPLKVNSVGLALGGTKPGSACSSLMGQKDGLSELWCLALLEARRNSGHSAASTEPCCCWKGVCREVGWICRSSSLACCSGVWLVEVFSGSCGQNGFIRESQQKVMSLTCSCEGLSVIMDPGTDSQENTPDSFASSFIIP